MKQLKDFFDSSFNFVTVVIPLIFSVLLWIAQPNGNIHTWIFIITLFICLLLLWLLIIAILALQNRTPKYNFSIRSLTNNVCLCSANPFLSHDSIVSFYLIQENGFENLIGYGIISNIQTNGFIQIDPHSLPNTVVSDSEDPFIKILTKYRKDIIIKSIVTKKIIENMNKFD